MEKPISNQVAKKKTSGVKRKPVKKKSPTRPTPPPPPIHVPKPFAKSNISRSEEERLSSSESEWDVLEVNKDNEDYFELPPGKKQEPAVPTKDLVHIPKDKLTSFKELYEKQPQKVKEMMRLTFCGGKPVTKPQPLSLFINRVKNLQDKKRSKKQLKRRHFKELFQTHKPKKPVEAKVNLVDVFETDTQLIHVDYPGRVVNSDKAMQTMGGVGQITKVFNNVSKKLNVRFRPDDPTCNSVRGEAVSTIGLLLRVRFRKKVQKSKQPGGNNDEEAGPSSAKPKNIPRAHNEPCVVINGVSISKSQIMFEDNELMKKSVIDNDRVLHRYYNSNNLERSFLKIPKAYKPTVDKSVRIETLGIVNRTYKFDGICDFQYLPLNNSKIGSISNRDELFPVVGTPSENEDSLFVSDTLFEGVKRDEFADFLPPLMSRIDKPLEMVIENLMDSDNVKLSEELKEKSSIICSSRARRNVFTITYSFVKENSNVSTRVPQEPLEGAIEDVKKRPNFENSVELIRKLFDVKPVWSKVALDIEAKHISTAFTLKYILPVLAYFATNGPWRALWIRLGYDPREHQEAFLYQTVDFRIPGIYKCHIDEPEKSDETFYIFKPNIIPPRGQMFYQLCYIKCEEIDRLIATATQKASNNELVYDHRFGWLKEGTFDYLRHLLIQYMEATLEELGKLPEHRTTKIFIPEGELEATVKLLSRPRKVRRMRKVISYKPKPKGTEHNVTKSTKRTTRSSKNAKPESTKWAYQGILEDLSIKEIGKYKTRQNEDEDKEILDDDSLISDEDSEPAEEYVESASDSEDDYEEPAKLITVKSKK